MLAQNPASQTFIWQADACGLIVDGDAWVSSIETLDVNDDGVGDIWLNLMSRRDMVGSENLTLFGFRLTLVTCEGRTSLSRVPLTRASYASSLLDLDRDGVSEIIVSNLDGPIEIWRQIRAFRWLNQGNTSALSQWRYRKQLFWPGQYVGGHFWR